jgi:hypothetical protein
LLKKNANEGDRELKIVTLAEVEKLGRENPKESIRAQPDDIFCCMYTSGSSECGGEVESLFGPNLRIGTSVSFSFSFRFDRSRTFQQRELLKVYY